MTVATSEPGGERLVPASLRGQTIHVACPDWCVVDHAATDEHYLEDVSHLGKQLSMTAPVGLNGSEDVLVAHVSQWTFSGETHPYLALDATGSGEFSELTKVQALAFADQIVAHAAMIRSLAERMTSKTVDTEEAQ